MRRRTYSCVHALAMRPDLVGSLIAGTQELATVGMAVRRNRSSQLECQQSEYSLG